MARRGLPKRELEVLAKQRECDHDWSDTPEPSTYHGQPLHPCAKCGMVTLKRPQSETKGKGEV